MQDWLGGIHPLDIVAGFWGGVVSAIARRDLGPWQVISSMIVGVTCAAFLTPMAMGQLIKYGFAASDGLSSHGVAFLVGVGGLTFCQGFLAAITRWMEKASAPSKSEGDSK